MRTTAEVEELTGFIDRNLFIGLRELLDEVTLHEISFGLETRKPLLVRQEFTRIRQVLLHQFLHLLLDLLKVLRREWSWAIKVVKEPVFSGRSVSKFRFWKELQHGSRQQMR